LGKEVCRERRREVIFNGQKKAALKTEYYKNLPFASMTVLVPQSIRLWGGMVHDKRRGKRVKNLCKGGEYSRSVIT